MTERRRYNIGVSKLPPHQRTIAHAVLPDDDAWTARGYRDVMGSDSDHPDGLARFPYGADVTYSVELTDAEAERFAGASNLRYIEEDGLTWPARYVARIPGAPEIPTLSTLGYLRARYVDLRRWHGRDVTVAVLDQGTTAAVRDTMGYQLIARTNKGSGVQQANGLVSDDFSHGCLVAPNAVPYGGRLLDCLIINQDGSGPYSAMAAGITWAVDNGAQVINISFSAGSTPGEVPPQVILDACAYARDHGNVQIVIAAGNDSLADLNSPGTASRQFANVHSSIAFDQATDRRALFSNYAADASGCGPGIDVTSLDIFGGETLWDGTSASTPHMTQILARAMSGGTYTATQVGAAAKVNTRPTGAPAAEQGKGAYDLQRIVAALGAIPATPTVAGVATPTHVGAVGGAATTASWNLTPLGGIAVDDMQLAIMFSSVGASIVIPDGWTMLLDSTYRGVWENAATANTVGPTRCRVLSRAYSANQPASQTYSFGGGTWFSALVMMTLRGAGGLDPERFAPAVRFGVGASVTTVSVLPATTNDLLVTAFSQRQANAPAGSLSVPSGLTSRGFWRPASPETTGYTALAATTALTSGARTATYTSTANDSAGTWCSVAFTVPGGAAAIDPVTQTEPGGPAGGISLQLPHA